MNIPDRADEETLIRRDRHRERRERMIYEKREERITLKPFKITLPNSSGERLLTYSRLSSFRTCPRKHYIEYICRIRPSVTAHYFRIGTVVHSAREQYDLLRNSVPDWEERRDICELLMRLAYRDMDQPSWADAHSFACERETTVALFRAHCWRWHEEEARIEIISLEEEFHVPVVNPMTGAPSPVWIFGGKRDRMERWIDRGIIAVRETKTTSQDISPGSDYWKRLRIDGQPTGYINSARQQGHWVDCAIFDVIRKPTLRPRQIPILDDDGIKIVRDSDGERVKTKNGNKWRETADTAAGYVLDSRLETPEEFGCRVESDCYANPDFYFRREEIARTDSDLEEYRHELWQQQLAVREAERSGRHFKNPGACLGFGKCPFFDLCTGGFDYSAAADPSSPVPEGFERLITVHPELTHSTKETLQDVNCATSGQAATDCQAACSTAPSGND